MPESYVRELERQVNQARGASGCPSTASSSLPSMSTAANSSHHEGESAAQNYSLESSSAEGFVQRLKELSSSSVADGTAAVRSPDASPAGEGHYTYSRLKFDLFSTYTLASVDIT